MQNLVVIFVRPWQLISKSVGLIVSGLALRKTLIFKHLTFLNSLLVDVDIPFLIIKGIAQVHNESAVFTTILTCNTSTKISLLFCS